MHDLERQGLWLFKHRSYLPLASVVLFVAAFTNYTYPFRSHQADACLEILCFAIAFVGLGIRIHTVGHAPDGTSGRTTRKPKATVLNTTGMYSLVRHPLYLGNLLIWGAMTVFLHSLLFTCACLAIFIIYYERIIVSEEAFLKQKFGQTYIRWAARTPMFVPHPRNWVAPNLPFSWKTALKREYSGLFVITTSLTVLEILGDLFSQGWWDIEWTWVVVFAAGAVVYVTLRALKKSGRLDVARRYGEQDARPAPLQGV